MKIEGFQYKSDPGILERPEGQDGHEVEGAGRAEPELITYPLPSVFGEEPEGEEWREIDPKVGIREALYIDDSQDSNFNY